MKTLLLLIFAPRYRAEMPEDKPGKWVACAIRTCARRPSIEVETREVDGLLNAYRVARWLALKLDWRTPYAGGEIGVLWAVRKLETL